MECSNQVSHGLTRKYWTLEKVTGNYKHASLFCRLMTKGKKSFVRLATARCRSSRSNLQNLDKLLLGKRERGRERGERERERKRERERE